jgi:hypothetical protein
MPPLLMWIYKNFSVKTLEWELAIAVHKQRAKESKKRNANGHI